MSKNNSANKIKLTNIDDLFGINPVTDEIKMVELNELHTFRNHPFKVTDDEQMEELVESIRTYGILTPALVRKRAQGGYELVSGHRRKHAAELVGLDEMPVIVRDYTDDEATIIMVDSNVQREKMLLSEKARAYKLKYDAIKHRGQKKEKRTLEEMGENTGESTKTVQRYIWLSRLNSEMLELVDAKKLGFTQGVNLSFLSQEDQELIYEYICSNKVTVSVLQSGRLKEQSQYGTLTYQTLQSIFTKKTCKRKEIVLKEDRVTKYFGSEYSAEDIEKIIIQLLEEWSSKERCCR